MIKKLSFISLFTIGISIIASAQISWAFKVNFNDGGKNYSGLLALNKDGCGAIRLKSSTGAIFDQILHWAPTQWEDSYWLLSDKITVISGTLTGYNPVMFLVRIHAQSNLVSIFANSHLLYDEHKDNQGHSIITFYPANDNISIPVANAQIFGDAPLDQYARTLDWSIIDAVKVVRNVQPRFYKG